MPADAGKNPMSGATPQRPWEQNPNSSTSGRSTTPLGPSLPGDGQPRPWDEPSTNDAASSGPLPATTSQPSVTGQYQNNLTMNSLYRPTYRGPGAYGGNTYGYRSPYGSGYGYGGGYGNGYNSYYQPTLGYGNTYGSPYQPSFGYGGTYGAAYQSSLGMGLYNTPGRPHAPGGPVMPGEGHTQGWQTFLQALHKIVDFFGRVSFLVDENAQALHFFISALLQLLDRAGSLYGELARYVLRLLGWKRVKKNQFPQGVQNGQKGPIPGHAVANRQPGLGITMSTMDRAQDAAVQAGYIGQNAVVSRGQVPVGRPEDSFRTAWQERTH